MLLWPQLHSCCRHHRLSPLPQVQRFSSCLILKLLSFKSSSTTSPTLISMPSLLCSLNAPTSLQVPYFASFKSAQVTPPLSGSLLAGVPGSFYGNLFPKVHLNLAYSSCALCWLSDLPPELSETTPAYNRARIHYTGASVEVAQAYSCQYKKDIKSFLRARSQELAEDWLVALIVPGVPDGFLDCQASTGSEFDLLGSCLMDMAKEGRINEEEVDSFNLPIYYTTPKELEDIIRSNGELNIYKMETLVSMDAQDTMPDLESRVLYLRAVLEGLIRTHFGHQILDLFDRYALKLAHSSFILQPQTHKSIMIFALLTRCHDI